MYPAHIRIDDDNSQIVQTVEAHCRNCAKRAAALAGVHLSKTAYLAGLLHDMGKCTKLFQDYITAAVNGQPVRRGSVNHTFAGVRYAMERWHKDGAQSLQNLTCELIAFSIGAHHGLFDIMDPDGRDGFLYRIQKEKISYEEAKGNFLVYCTSEQELDHLFEQAVLEVQVSIDRCRTVASTQQELLFYLSLLERVLLSALIDGDRQDTMEFLSGQPLPIAEEGTAQIWQDCLWHLERYLSKMNNASAISQARQEISDQCLAAAKRKNGVYRLSVPTGSGKTLASLRYALAAAAKGKRRILFVIPLLSVLEQNAAIIRQAVGNDGLIFEHHSNVVQTKQNDGELDQNELLMDTWNTPILITTLVQLLNTLFAGQTSCIRRMNALRDSVIIIDEVQSVPRKMLTLFNLAMNFLTCFSHATVVLCSATQPCLAETAHRLRYQEPPELIPWSESLWAVFRRTDIIDLRQAAGYTESELAELTQMHLTDSRSILLICNTKSEARTLYQALKHTENTNVFHLSTAMCMAHRMKWLEQINRGLADHQTPTICVSTQLVEAGVDFSFDCVIRITAGLDNIVQAAGRCNRHGEMGKHCPVYIVNLRGETLNHLSEIREAQQAAEELLERYARSPESYGNDLASGQAIRHYYQCLYAQMKTGSQDYTVPRLNTSLYKMLSDNRDFTRKRSYTLCQSFETAGKAFSVFENNTTDVLVPYGRGVEIIADLCSKQAEHDLQFRSACVRRAKPYTVSLYDYEIKQLGEFGGIEPLWGEAILALDRTYYLEETGFSMKGGAEDFLSV